MSDFPIPGTGLGPGDSNSNSHGHGSGGGNGSWFRGFQRTRTPTAVPGTVDACDAWNGDDAPASLSLASATAAAAFEDNIAFQQREQSWEQLDREREQKTQYRADEDRDQSTSIIPFTSPSKQNKPAGHRHGITFPQRVSSLLNLSGIGGGGGGGNDQRSKIASPFKPFVPSGIDPRTPVDNPWQIPAVASAPGPVHSTNKNRKKSFFFGNGDEDENEDEYDPDYFGHRRFPKVGEGSQAVGAWHNPNMMQIVESLQTAMMNKRDPMEHIPVVYNSYVLTLIEAFGKLTTQLQCMESEIAELKNLREKELEEFRGMSEEWIEREHGYKAEIKRLELVLAKESKDGVASVALARHNSLVDRSEGKRFQARLKRMSGSHQEGIKEQTVPEEVETPSVAHTPSCYQTLSEIPRSIDTNQDLLASRLVEKLERDEKARQLSDAGGIRNNTQAHTLTKGYQKQAPQQIPGKKVAATTHEKPFVTKALRPIPEIKGLKVETALDRAVDDGLTVGREAYRSVATVNRVAAESPTGASLLAQCEPPTAFLDGSNIKREALNSGRQKLEFQHVIHGSDRRYSFSHGDDEILPVTPSAPNFKEAEARRVIEIPTGNSSTGELPGTSTISPGPFSTTALPLSTSTSSTGSVIWLGETGSLDGPERLAHTSTYMEGPPNDARGGTRCPHTPAVYLPEQLCVRGHATDLSGSVVYSPTGFACALTPRDDRDAAGSASKSYVSPTIRTVLEVDTNSVPKPSLPGERYALPQAFLVPANDKGLRGNLSATSSPETFFGRGETTSNVARIAAARATQRDDQQN